LHALWTRAELGVLDDERFLFHVDAILKTPWVDVGISPQQRSISTSRRSWHGVEVLRNADQHSDLKSCANIARHFVERFAN